MLRIVYMGTPEFAAKPLESIIEAGYDVIGVVTQKDKPCGRGGKVKFPPVKEVALEHDIEVFQPDRMKNEESIEWVRMMAPDIIVVAAFGQILPKAVLDIPKYGCVNIHASLLPKLRGAAPIQQAVIDGDEYAGITIMQMDEGLDTGDIMLQEAVKLADDETGGSLHDKLVDIGSSLIIKALAGIEDGSIKKTPQAGASSYAAMLDKKMGHIDYSGSAIGIERLIRGLNPWPSAYSYLHGKMMKIWEADVLTDEEFRTLYEQEYPEDDHTEKNNGEIIHISKEYIYIKTGSGILRIKSIQPEGKKRMDTASYLRGAKVFVGDKME